MGVDKNLSLAPNLVQDNIKNNKHLLRLEKTI